MNPGQRVVLILSFLVVLGMALFPPWIYVYDPPQSALRQEFVRAERPAGYHLIFGVHIPEDQTALMKLFNLRPQYGYEWEFFGLQFFSVRMDGTRLAIQITAALVLTATLYLALRTNLGRRTH